MRRFARAFRIPQVHGFRVGSRCVQELTAEGRNGQSVLVGGSMKAFATKSSTHPRETIRKSGAAVAWLICSAAMAHGQTPTVVSAIVNSTTKQITISGTSLTATGAPVVKLDSAT